MSRIITRMTRGRITTGTTKKVLVLAVAGILYFTGAPPVVPPTPITPYSNVDYNDGIGGSGGLSTEYDDRQLIRRRILVEDGEIIAIVELTLKIVII